MSILSYIFFNFCYFKHKYLCDFIKFVVFAKKCNRNISFKIKYTVGSVFYRRDILGERCVAEGLIYPMFANDPKKYIIKKEDVPKLTCINIGVDFGGNKSNHAFVAMGIDKTFTNMYVLKSWSLKAAGQPVEYVDAMYDKFKKAVISEYGFVNNTFADSAEQTINTQLGKDISVFGHGAELLYIDNDGEIR